MKKLCPQCNKKKTVREFYPRSTRPGQYSAYCISCFSERHKDYYRANKQYYLDKKNHIREQLEEQVRQLKSKPCSDCRKKYPYYVMDFDHREGEEKVGNIARLIRSGQVRKTLDEINKCDLVCSNCHRTRTHKRLMVGEA